MNDRVVQGSERLSRSRCSMEKRLDLTRPIRSIGLLGKKLASIRLRTTQLSRRHRG